MPLSSAVNFKPDFLIVGATRCGTTSLHEALAEHRGICVPHKKEIKFFYIDKLYRRGLDFYASHFAHRQDGQLCGEVCPLYFDKGLGADDRGPVWRPQDDSAVRIQQAYPGVPLFISLRDPIKRAHSIFWKNKWQGREAAESFEQAIEEELAGQRKPEETPFCYIWRNRYSEHLAHWRSLFDPAHIHVMIFEEWTKNPQVAVDAFTSALPLPDDPSWGAAAFAKKNEGRRLAHPWLKPISALGDQLPLVRSVTRRFLTQPGYPPISAQVAQRLRAEFAPDVAALEAMIGRGIDVWLSEG